MSKIKSPIPPATASAPPIAAAPATPANICNLAIELVENIPSVERGWSLFIEAIWILEIIQESSPELRQMTVGLEIGGKLREPTRCVVELSFRWLNPPQHRPPGHSGIEKSTQHSAFRDRLSAECWR
jgi:hypothetical protein